jgi:hypothetical protein
VDDLSNLSDDEIRRLIDEKNADLEILRAHRVLLDEEINRLLEPPQWEV